MIVAAGGGERDYAADAAILAALRGAADPGALLNERLLTTCGRRCSWRSLSNLLAGQHLDRAWRGRLLAHLHGRGGRGYRRGRIACARIAAGQGDLFLVGGSFNAERPDVLLH